MKSIVIIILIFCPFYVYGQSIVPEKNLSLGFQVGYLFPQNTGGSPYSTLIPDLEYRLSIQYKLSKKITSVLEYSYSKLKYKSEEKERRNQFYTFQSIDLGLKIYPKSEENIYLKTALSSPIQNNLILFPNLSLGIGTEINISKEINLFGGANLIFGLSSEYRYSFLLGTGLTYKIF